MPTLDAQVHAYERNHPDRPRVGILYGPAEVTGEVEGGAHELGLARLR